MVSDAFIGANRTRIITLALEARLPTILSFRDYVQAGGLMSYGPNFANYFRRTAELVDKDFARDEARRHPGGAADKVRVCRQSLHRKGAWADDFRIDPVACQRGDRIAVISGFGIELLVSHVRGHRRAYE